MKTHTKISLVAVGATMFGVAACTTNENSNYSKFPVTVKTYKGKKTNSVAYTGQIARHVLHESIKKLASKGNGSANPALRARMMSYYAGKDAGRAIISPTGNSNFPIVETKVDQISKKKNLSGKTYKGSISGMPNQMTGPDLIKFWIDKASSAKKGQDKANGYDYPQLISKFIMGAVFYNQAVDNYLDEKLGAKTKPNDKPYKKGAPYTGKEHSWDEAWGYFGAPAHVMSLSAKQVYEIAKKGSKSKPKSNALTYADTNKDGKVNLYGEMTHSPAYYAASFDKGGKTSYLKNIAKAFLDGRSLLASAKGSKLSDSERASLRSYAAIIEENWEKSLAEAVFKYAGSVYKDLKSIKAKGPNAKSMKNYIKHWGELKGFSLSLQTGRKNLGETAVKLNRLIGYGPVMPNSSQVTDIDSKGNYVKSQSNGLENYMLHMLKVQKLLIDKMGVTARSKDSTAGMKAMIESLGSGAAAEND
ncbi:MAG: DUF4856 domain-containing protein [Pseudomonadota bacterium]|nr:DUF4856 domain-containing protein [Pseudomonadota bacterium]